LNLVILTIFFEENFAFSETTYGQIYPLLLFGIGNTAPLISIAHARLANGHSYDS